MDVRPEELLRSFPLAKQVTAALEGAVFPLSGSHLCLVARENEAPATLLTLFSRLGHRTFCSLDEVEAAMDTPGIGSGLRE